MTDAELAAMAETGIVQPMTPAWKAALLADLKLNTEAGRGLHSSYCASIRYPGSYDQPPDPCTCYAEEVASLLVALDAVTKAARGVFPEVMEAEIGSVIDAPIMESLARVEAKAERWVTLRRVVGEQAEVIACQACGGERGDGTCPVCDGRGVVGRAYA